MMQLAACMLPIAYFGWQGVLSSLMLVIALTFWTFRRRAWAMGCVAILVVGQTAHPVLDSARPTILNSKCQSSLRQLTIAIHNYHDAHGQLPPPYSTDETGRPLHSWRVLILPFLEETELYDLIDKTKPWDDPVNRPFHDRMPAIFCCEVARYNSYWLTTGKTTPFIAVVDPATVWHPDKTRTLPGISASVGTANKICLVEAEMFEMPWMSPNDPDLASLMSSLKSLGKRHHSVNVSMLECNVRRLSVDFLQSDEFKQMMLIE